MLTFIQNFNVLSTPLDATDIAASNQVAVINATTFQIYNINSGATVGSAVTATATHNASVCLINAASATVFDSTATGADLIELSTGYLQHYAITTGTVNLAGTKGQQSAGDVANNRVMACGPATKLIVMDGNTFTGTTVTLSRVSNVSGATKFTCVIYKSSDRWLVGSDGSYIYEVDHLGNVYKQLSLPLRTDGGYRSVQGNSILIQPTIQGMSYDSACDTLLVSTLTGWIFAFNYTTGTLLYQSCTMQGTTSVGSSLTVASSGTTIMAYNTQTNGNSNIVAEVDFTQAPVAIRDVLFLGTNIDVLSCGIQKTTGWVLRKTTDNKITTFTITSRNASTQSILVQSPSGTNTAARVINIVDPGVGSAYVDSDTVIPASTTGVYITKGQTVYTLTLEGTGTDTKFELHKNSS